MAKKFSLLTAAVALLAFVIPAMASAAPAVTSSPGVLAPKGTKITATSTNTVMLTSLGNIACAETTYEGEVTENTGTNVKGIGVGAGSSSGCTLGGSKAITVTDLTVSSLTSTVANKGTISATFLADLPSEIVCHFSVTNGPFTYETGKSSIKVASLDFVATPAACEPGTVRGDYAITLSGSGASVILD